MIYTVRPLSRQIEILIYLCSLKETSIVLEEIEKLDIDYITGDEGILSYDDDPFLLSQINAN
jgi:hypothetical protein